jgi:hypothetical protein
MDFGPGKMLKTTVLQGNKMKCIFLQFIHQFPNVSITAAFFIKIYYLQSLCGKLLYQLLSTQDFQLIQPQLNQLPLLPTVFLVFSLLNE